MPKLPVSDLAAVSIGGQGENLMVYLQPVDSEAMRERIGREKVIGFDGPVEITQGTLFRSQRGNTRGMRYLYRDPAGDIVGALNLTKIGRRAVVSNLYVRPDKRQTGIATALVDAARRQHRALEVDTSMTEAGARFFGYDEAMVAAARAREVAREAQNTVPAPRPR